MVVQASRILNRHGGVQPATRSGTDDDVPADHAAAAIPGVEALYRTHRDRSIRLATALLGDRDRAEEVVHDAYLALSLRWADVDEPAAYLRTAVVNGCRSHQRRRVLDRDRRPPAPPLTVIDPELDELWTQLARLSPRRRAALVLRYYEDLPIDDIARLLDCRPGTVSSLLHRGLADLRKVIDR